MPKLDVEALHRERRQALLTDGTIVPVKWFDGDGEETDDCDEALVFVCGKDDVWLVYPTDVFIDYSAH